jgi:hypothetical protein
MKNFQKMGGIAALYMAVAYLAAIPYFLVLVNYPSVVDPVEKVILLRDNYTSMFAMHVVVYEFVGIGMVVLGLALYHRLKGGAPALAQLATVMGLIWACLLLASSMVFNYGMEAVVGLYATDPTKAVLVWQAIEPVAQGLGGAGGELLGGLWILLVSLAAFRAGALPRALNWFGVVIAAAGLISVVPALKDAAVVFGLLLIVWFARVGVVMLRGSRGVTEERSEASVPRRETPSFPTPKPTVGPGR